MTQPVQKLIQQIIGDKDLIQNHISIKEQSLPNENSLYLNTTFHWHSNYELELITDGTAVHLFNDETYRLTKGSIYLCTVNDMHTIKLSEDEHLNIINIAFDDYYLGRTLINFFSENSSGWHCQLEDDTYKVIIECIKNAKYEIEGNNILRDKMIGYYLGELIVTFIRCCNSRPGNENTYIPLINSAIRCLGMSKDKFISLKEIANELNVSPNYIGNLFKRSTGKSFSQYQMERKISRAEQLLLMTGKTVREIGEELGFVSTSYFTKCFKRAHGITPEVFRNKDE